MDQTQLAEIADKEYRHGLVTAQIEVDLPFQIRALRKQRNLTQPELAELTGMKQPRFPLMEKPGGARFTLETLRRLAKAFDVALIVKFAPFSELLEWSENFYPDSFCVASFDGELAQLEKQKLSVGFSPDGALAEMLGKSREISAACLSPANSMAEILRNQTAFPGLTGRPASNQTIGDVPRQPTPVGVPTDPYGRLRLVPKELMGQATGSVIPHGGVSAQLYKERYG
jgi:transcriptional regulator with XRE-family HTH domain